MNILTIGNASSPHILGRAKAFIRAGSCNKILTEQFFEDPDIEIISPFEDFTGNSAWKRPLCFLKNIIKAIKIVRAEDYDMLHIYFASHYLTWVASFVSSKPIILIVMGGDVLFEQHQYVSWYQRLLVKKSLIRADLVIAKSPYIEERAKILCHGKINIVNCIFGVNNIFFEKMHNKNHSTLKFISSRPVNSFYNLDKILDVIHHLNKKEYSVELNILCFYPNEKYLDFLKNKVRELKLGTKVHFLPGVCTPDELIPLYRFANFVIALPSSDGIPQSALEGMAQGCINILPQNVAYKNIFNSQNSILVTGDAEQIAQQIAEKISANKLAEITYAARKFVENHGHLDKNIKQLMKLFKKIIEHQKYKDHFLHKINVMVLLSVYFFDQFFLLGIRNKFVRK